MRDVRIDLEGVKIRQQATWSAGDFARIGSRLQIVGETLCEAADIHAGDRVIDVAAGNGNGALAAARRFARVVAVDYVPALLEAGRRRAEADGLDVEFRLGDAEALPCEDASFDVALSSFGVMFAPDHARAARELARVVRPGGRIALACWTPRGFVGEMFRLIAGHVPPPPGLAPPALWGTEEHLHALFGAELPDMQAACRTYTMRFLSAEHYVDYFRTYFGPMVKAFEAVGEAGAPALERDLLEMLARWNRARNGTLVIGAEYLEAVVTL